MVYAPGHLLLSIESSPASVERLLEALDPDDAEAVLARRTTFPSGPMFEKVDLHRFWQGGWPATVVCASGRTIPGTTSSVAQPTY